MNPATHTVADDEMINTHANDETRVLCYWCPHMNARNACEFPSHRSDKLSALSHSLSDAAIRICKKQIAPFNCHSGTLRDRNCIFLAFQHTQSRWFDLVPQCLKTAHTLPRSCVTKATPLYGGNFRIIDINIPNQYEKSHSFLHLAKGRLRKCFFSFFSVFSSSFPLLFFRQLKVLVANRREI